MALAAEELASPARFARGSPRGRAMQKRKAGSSPGSAAARSVQGSAEGARRSAAAICAATAAGTADKAAVDAGCSGRCSGPSAGDGSVGDVGDARDDGSLLATFRTSTCADARTVDASAATDAAASHLTTDAAASHLTTDAAANRLADDSQIRLGEASADGSGSADVAQKPSELAALSSVEDHSRKRPRARARTPTAATSASSTSRSSHSFPLLPSPPPRKRVALLRNSNGHVFAYSSATESVEIPANGLLHWIGTEGAQKEWVNPCISGEVTLRHPFTPPPLYRPPL